MPQDFGLPLLEAARLSGVTIAEHREPQDRYVVANGLRLHYLDWGSKGKPWMLCLHGGSQNAHMWDFTALAFCHLYHIIALDQRGHGDSQWASDGDYSLEAHQKDILAFVNALGMDRFMLVGLSLGGHNSYTFAARYPERMHALVVVDVGPEINRQGSQRIGNFVSQPDELDSFEAFVQRTRAYNFRRPEWQIRGGLRHNLKELPNGRWTWKYDKVLRDPAQRALRAAVTDSSSAWKVWTRIQCPVLLVRGSESDILALTIAQKMQEMLPGTHLVEVPGAGHLVPGDNPVAWEGALRGFLQELEVRAR